MLIATWNVNSIQARLPQVHAWMQAVNPDVVLLQELKCVTDAFPREAFEDLNYNVAVHGQKTYNGVAILSKTPIEEVKTTFMGQEEDQQARYIEAFIGKLRVASLYVPNGQEVGSDKFVYKLNFLKNLKRHFQDLFAQETPFIIGGDFNIAPFEKDAYDPRFFKNNHILCSLQERKALREILNLGYGDALRMIHPTADNLFTWWDYRAASFQNDHGFRIDHILLSGHAMDLLEDAYVDKGPRSNERPSDHIPVCIKLR